MEKLKYQITIQDNETGETKVFDTNFYAAHFQDGEHGFRSIMEGMSSLTGVLMLLMVLDNRKETIFKDHPEMKLFYDLRNEFIQQSAEVDINELRNQMGGNAT